MEAEGTFPYIGYELGDEYSASEYKPSRDNNGKKTAFSLQWEC